jgi:hypothetical protein
MIYCVQRLSKMIEWVEVSTNLDFFVYLPRGHGYFLVICIWGLQSHA